jgi:phage shock protein E
MSILEKLFGGLAATETQMPIDATLIDVRTPVEYASGYIEGAISLPLDRLSQTVQAAIVDKARPIIVYCASGGRSASAKGVMLKLGYENVVNGGGIGGLALKLHKPICRGGE